MSICKFKIHNIRDFMFISIMVLSLEYALTQYWINSEDKEITWKWTKTTDLIGYSHTKIDYLVRLETIKEGLSGNWSSFFI